MKKGFNYTPTKRIGGVTKSGRGSMAKDDFVIEISEAGEERTLIIPTPYGAIKMIIPAKAVEITGATTEGGITIEFKWK